MKHRTLGPEGLQVTECGLGCWQLGGGWGNPWDDRVAQEILGAAYASGIRFFDTADGYGKGESERSLGRFRQSHPDIVIATAERHPELTRTARRGSSRPHTTALRAYPGPAQRPRL